MSRKFPLHIESVKNRIYVFVCCSCFQLVKAWMMYMYQAIIGSDTSSSSKFYFQQNTLMMQEQKTLCKCKNAHDVKTLLHSAVGHQGYRKAHQAGNLRIR